MRDAFFSPKCSKCAWYFNPKTLNAHAIFRRFFDFKNMGRSQQPSVLGQLVTGEFQRTGISCHKESQSYLLMNKFH